MSRSNYDKPFYVDVGTSAVAIRCASNHDVVEQFDLEPHPYMLNNAKAICYRMNREAEIGRPRRNCDRFETAEDAKKEFNYLWNFVWKRGGGYVDEREYRSEYEKWLFSPIQEGETNGSR